MARYLNGWVKVHRKVMSSWIGRDPIAFSILNLLVMWANPEDGRERFVGGLQPLKRGQLVTSAPQIAAHFDIDKKTVMRRLRDLETDGTIVQEVTFHGRLITIQNYDKYQGSDSDECPADVPPRGPQKGLQNGLQNPHIVKKEEAREIFAQSVTTAPEEPFAFQVEGETLPQVWNLHCGSLPKVTAVGKARALKIKARLAEHPDLAYWKAAVQKMAASSFCRENKFATFDWLIKNDNNHVKVSEGNYDNRPAAQAARAPAGRDMSELDPEKAQILRELEESCK